MQGKNANKTKADRTRGRLLDVAAHLFREHGYSEVRLADIAKAARIQKGSLYYHFDSREEIVRHVLDAGVSRVLDAVRDRVAALPASATWRDRIVAGMEEHLRMALEQDDYTAANVRIHAHVPAAVRKRHAVLRRRYGAFWRTLLARAAEAGELRADLHPPIVRMFLLGSVTWSVEWFRPGPLSVDEVAHQMTSILFDGIAAKPRARRRV